MRVNIVEIVGRSNQGTTRPFICRADNGLLYYVKGYGAGNKALISEWVAGNIGKRLGLPIPDIVFAVIPQDLLLLSARDDVSELGSGVAFASQAIANADELSYVFIEQIEVELRAKILFFDWWVLNGDRTLTEYGGNPNILWVHRDQKPYVIDNNLAFEESTLVDFWTQHIFASARGMWTPSFRQNLVRSMEQTLSDLDNLWDEMPSQWTEIETTISLDLVRSLLSRFETEPDSFWRDL